MEIGVLRFAARWLWWFLVFWEAGARGRARGRCAHAWVEYSTNELRVVLETSGCGTGASKHSNSGALVRDDSTYRSRTSPVFRSRLWLKCITHHTSWAIMETGNSKCRMCRLIQDGARLTMGQRCYPTPFHCITQLACILFRNIDNYFQYS